MNGIEMKGTPQRLSGEMSAKIAAGGLAAGVINGIFGNGGGVVVVFLLGGICRDIIGDGRRVFANVTAAVLPMALTSALIYSSFSAPSVSDAVAVASSSLAGGVIGASLIGRISAVALRKIFAAVMVISGAVMLFGR
jgi:uncharacterized membrane protein YfcA